MVKIKDKTVIIDDKKFTVGGKVWANAETGWQGLKGTVTEVHIHGENGNVSVTLGVDFEAPISREMIQNVENNFSEAYASKADIRSIPMYGVQLQASSLEPIAASYPERSDDLYVLTYWYSDGKARAMPLCVSTSTDILLLKMEEDLKEYGVYAPLNSAYFLDEGDNMEFHYCSPDLYNAPSTVHYSIARVPFYANKEVAA